METYIASVLHHTYLPASVKEEIESILREECEQLLSENADADLTAAIGAPYDVAEAYNLSYRDGIVKRTRRYNSLTALLTAAIIVLSFFCVSHVYRYAEERVRWYRAQAFTSVLSQMTTGGSQSGEEYSRMIPEQKLKELSDPEASRPVVFQSTISFEALALYGLGISLCGVLISYLSYLRMEWRSYKQYIPPTRERSMAH